MSQETKIRIDRLKAHPLVPGGQARFIHSEHISQAYWTFEPGAVLAEHSHPHEQIVNLLEGKLEFRLDGEVLVLEPGEAVICPPHAVHSGKALTAVRVLDVFYPVREDFVKLG